MMAIGSMARVIVEEAPLQQEDTKLSISIFQHILDQGSTEQKHEA